MNLPKQVVLWIHECWEGLLRISYDSIYNGESSGHTVCDRQCQFVVKWWNVAIDWCEAGRDRCEAKWDWWSAEKAGRLIQ